MLLAIMLCVSSSHLGIFSDAHLFFCTIHPYKKNKIDNRKKLIGYMFKY